jgi:N-acetylmuramoyl-L-alanine amidase
MWRAAAVLFLLPGFAASNSGINQVTGIHFWTHPDYTSIAFDATGTFDIKSERAFHPDRIFFDLPGRPWINGHRYATQVVDDKLVYRIRIAETAPGMTRIVLDMKVPATFKVSRLDSPSRIFVELKAMRPDSPLMPHPDAAPATPSASAPGPLPYVSSSAVPPTTVLPPAATPPPIETAFVYPPSYRQVPRFRTPVLAGSPPVLTPPPLMTAWLPDPGLQIAMARPPRKVAPLAASAAIAPPIAPPVALPVPESTTKVIPASRPLPYDAKARASENASRSLTRALGLKVNRIVIDAGHGGHDEGTSGPNGVLEKDVVLDVALRLAKLVQTKMGAEVVLTRSDDTFIPLQQRTAIANDHGADLFLSIHANSSPSSSVAGTETFFLNFTNSPAALDVAARENAGSDRNVGQLKDLIQSITLNDKIAESETFAQQIQNAIFAQAAKSNAVAKNRGVKRAPFVVLIGASMPSVLAEIGFLSNPRDEANLAKPEYRQKIAESLLKGLSQYAQSLSHFDVVAGKPEKPGLN